MEAHLPSQFIGPQLKAARERAGLKQSEIARQLGVDPAMVSRWEFIPSTRYVPVPSRHFEPLAFLLNVDIEELVPGLRRPIVARPLVLPEPTCNGVAKPTILEPNVEVPPPQDEEVGEQMSSSFSQETYSTGSTSTSMPSSPSPVPGRVGPPNEKGEYRLRLRCPWCRTMNVSYSADHSELPSDCSACGRRMRAQVTVTITPL